MKAYQHLILLFTMRSYKAVGTFKQNTKQQFAWSISTNASSQCYYSTPNLFPFSDRTLEQYILYICNCEKKQLIQNETKYVFEKKDK